MAEATLDFRLLEIDGPGGGNPRCEIVGLEIDLTAWLLEFYCPGEPEEASFMIWGD
jgi:hypothetical protein